LKGYKTLCRGLVNLTEVLQRDMAGDLTLVDKAGVPMAVLTIQHLKSSPGTGGAFADDDDDVDSDESLSEHVSFPPRFSHFFRFRSRFGLFFLFPLTFPRPSVGLPGIR
jgi:hypothetical protein